VGEKAVEPDHDAAPGEQVHADEEEDVGPVEGASVQLRALPHTCQPAMPTGRKGMIVTRPVMIRSLVSFSTGLDV
jgi:hypothetical protein